MGLGKILWLQELDFSWKASFIINLSIVQKYDRQDASLISVELGGGRHYMMLGELRVLAFISACILESDYFS